MDINNTLTFSKLWSFEWHYTTSWNARNIGKPWNLWRCFGKLHLFLNMSQKRCQKRFTSSATLLVLSGLHLQSIQQCLARLRGPEVTLKVLLPAPKRFALLPSKLLCPPRGGREAEESLSGIVHQHCLALSSRSQKKDRNAFCSITAPVWEWPDKSPWFL